MKPAHGILLLAAVLFVWNLWGYDLWAPDEPYFAEGAREMIVDGHWLVPHVNGVVSTDKPPLFFWLISLFSLPLGKVTSLTARLPSVLAALGTIALTMRLGRRFSGERAALVAGFTLCTLYMFWAKARWAQIDSTLCLLIWVSLSAFEGFRAGDADGRRAGLLFWSAAALAVLAKGPVGLLLPIGIALVSLAVDRRLGAWSRFAPLAGPAAFALIVAAWIALTELAGPDTYSVWGALKEHFVGRGIRGMHHRQPFWYYLEVLPPNLFPWTGLVPGALVLAWRRKDDADRFLLVAALFVVVFFSISTEKRELYALPAFPAFALMVARLAEHVLEQGSQARRWIGARWATGGQAVVGSLLGLVGLALIVAGRRFEKQMPFSVIVPLALLLLATAAATWVACVRQRYLGVLLAPAIGFVAVYLFVSTMVPPVINPSKSGRAFGQRIKEASTSSRAAGERVLAFGLSNLPESFAFYSDGVYTIETDDPERLVEHLRNEQTVLAVVNGNVIDTLPGDVTARLRVIDRTHLARRDVLLIANR